MHLLIVARLSTWHVDGMYVSILATRRQRTGNQVGLLIANSWPTLLKLLTRIPTVFDTQIRTIEERIAMVCALAKDRVL